MGHNNDSLHESQNQKSCRKVKKGRKRKKFSRSRNLIDRYLLTFFLAAKDL